MSAAIYARELRDGARRQQQYDRAWSRYVTALERFADKQADGRANAGRRRAMRAARRHLEAVCGAQGITCPVPQ
jgi:hypothetical protein